MSDPARKSIAQVRAEAREGALGARIEAQVEDVIRKEARNGKPFWEVKLRDGGDAMTLKAWSDTPQFQTCEDLAAGELVRVEGEFAVTPFGLDAQRWSLQRLEPAEAEALFAGDEATRTIAKADFSLVTELVASLDDLRLKALADAFLADFGARFRRAAAARFNHHAFRGGLLRHTAQMMKSADALCGVYPQLHRDLLLVGVLFHDSGKLWEMCPAETGFEIPRAVRGELLGHISIGIELVNALWRKLPLKDWDDLEPASEDVRLHLLHLIASHHGELAFGSPVEPKTPEAIALHYIDNLDAKMEMICTAYEKQPEIAPGIFDRVRALHVSPVRPLVKKITSRP
jgi:3'-5' exoribonuclease